jgi:hypothetical protein
MVNMGIRSVHPGGWFYGVVCSTQIWSRCWWWACARRRVWVSRGKVDRAPSPGQQQVWVSNGQLRGRLGTQSRAAAGLGA